MESADLEGIVKRTAEAMRHNVAFMTSAAVEAAVDAATLVFYRNPCPPTDFLGDALNAARVVLDSVRHETLRRLFRGVCDIIKDCEQRTADNARSMLKDVRPDADALALEGFAAEQVIEGTARARRPNLEKLDCLVDAINAAHADAARVAMGEVLAALANLVSRKNGGEGSGRGQGRP